MIKIPTIVLAKMLYLADKTEDELGALLKVENDIVTDILVLNQLSECAYFEIDERDVSAATMKLFDSGEDLSLWNGLFHTHPEGMSSNPSGVDDDMLIKQCGEVDGYSVILASPEKNATSIDVSASYAFRTRHGVLCSDNDSCTIIIGDDADVYHQVMSAGLSSDAALGVVIESLRSKTYRDLYLKEFIAEADAIVVRSANGVGSVKPKKGSAYRGYDGYWDNPDGVDKGVDECPDASLIGIHDDIDVIDIDGNEYSGVVSSITQSDISIRKDDGSFVSVHKNDILFWEKVDDVDDYYPEQPYWSKHF